MLVGYCAVLTGNKSAAGLAAETTTAGDVEARRRQDRFGKRTGMILAALEDLYPGRRIVWDDDLTDGLDTSVDIIVTAPGRDRFRKGWGVVWWNDQELGPMPADLYNRLAGMGRGICPWEDPADLTIAAAAPPAKQ